MAIIFAKGSGLNDDLWKANGTVIKSFLKDTDTEKSKDDELVSALFNEKKSDKFAEKSAGITEFANFEIVNEGDKGVQDSIQEGFSKMIEHKQFIKTFACTAEMNEDGDIDAMKEQAANFIRSYKRTRAQYASDALTAEGASFMFGKNKLDKTTGDGLGLFSTAHKTKVGEIVQSNVFTNAFGTDAKVLNRLAIEGRNFKNDSGNIMGYTYDTIIIPSNCPDLEDTVKKIIGSDGEVGTNNNDINTQRGKWKLIVDHRWEAKSGTAPYIIMSSEANTNLRGNMFYDRVPLTVRDQIDNATWNLEFSGRARMSAGFFNWRQVILGGASTGTTLTLS